MIQEPEDARIIGIQLQFRSKIPLSDQVRRGIFDLIQQGKLQEDQPLPTVRELAAQLGVNFNTVARAYRVLDQEGWLITRQGRGTVVTRPVREKPEDPFEEQLKRLVEEVHRISEELNIQPQVLLGEIEKRLIAPAPRVETRSIRSRRKRASRFRPYLAAFPRSRKTHKETLDWRLRKPITKGSKSH